MSVDSVKLVSWVRGDIRRNPACYREAVTWWNENYSRRIYRKKLAEELRKRRRSGQKLRRTRDGGAWHLKHRADWFFLRRVHDAMGSFPTDRSRWWKLGLDDAMRILLITAIVTDKDFDATAIGLDEQTPWSNGRLLQGDECFGRDRAYGSFREWNREAGDNALWLELAHTAMELVMQLRGEGAVPRHNNDVPDSTKPIRRVTPGPRRDGFASSSELAAEWELSAEVVRLMLERWRRAHAGSDGWAEVDNPRPRESKYLYDRAVVWPLLERAKERATRREIRRTKTYGIRTARSSNM